MATAELPQVEAATIDPLGSLASVVRLSEGRYTSAFAWYERTSQRSPLIGRLHRALPERKLVEVSLTNPRIDPNERAGQFFQNLRMLIEAEAAGPPFDAVLLLDWEKLLATKSEIDEQRSRLFLWQFNFWRHVLKATFSCPFLILVPQEAMKALERRAPDFVSWGMGTYFFPLQASRPDVEGEDGQDSPPS